MSVRDFFETFSRLLGRLFSDFFQTRDSCSSSEGSQTFGLPNLWFACGLPFTKTTEIPKTTKTTKTTQTATNKELIAGLTEITEITETTEMTKTTDIGHF